MWMTGGQRVGNSSPCRSAPIKHQTYWFLMPRISFWLLYTYHQEDTAVADPTRADMSNLMPIWGDKGISFSTERRLLCKKCETGQHGGGSWCDHKEEISSPWIQVLDVPVNDHALPQWQIKGRQLDEGVWWYQNDSGDFYELKLKDKYSSGPEEKI